MNNSAYIDTSALAKRYFDEPESAEVDRFLEARVSVSISRLTVVEFRRLLARRRRNHDINLAAERRAAAAFEEDVVQGNLEVHPLEDRHAIVASELLTRLAQIPLRTLDAIHLAIAVAIRAEVIATADRTFALASQALKMEVAWFGAQRLLRR